MTSITPCLWFDNQGEEAANFYTSIFKNSQILETSYYGEAGPGTPGTALTVEFELDGTRFTALNGGPADYAFNEAISFQIDCETQADVDHYWERLGEGGQPGPCGWLKDKYGVSWQVVPRRLVELLSDPDPQRSQRAMAAMLNMGKLDVAALEAAADGA